MANNLPTEGSEGTDFKNYIDVTREFFSLIKKVDSLPEVCRVKQDETRSLYKASAKTSKLDTVKSLIQDFFGEAAKPAGKSVPLMFRFNPVFKTIGGLKKSQTLYTKKVSTGIYYTAIWPWTRNPENMTVTMGFCSQRMSDRDYNALEQYIDTKILEERALEDDSEGIGGRLKGVSLPAFLQMSAMEKTSCTLKVRDRDVTGYLYLADGDLVNAVCGNLEGLDAAIHIICWEQPVIELEKAIDGVDKKIEMPLMHVLMEALKKKDEIDYNGGKPVSSEEKSIENYDMAVEVLPPVMDDSFVKLHTERSINKAISDIVTSKKISRKRKIRVYVGLALVAIIATGAVVFLNHKMDSDRIASEYVSITDGRNDVRRQKTLLEEFLKREEVGSGIRKKAEIKLKNVIHSIQTQDYRKLEKLLDDLIRVRKYDEALDSCKVYMDLYPSSQFASDAQKQMDRIEELKGKRDFTDLVKAAESSGKTRLAQLGNKFRDQGDSREGDDFKAFVNEMKDPYYLFVRKNVKRAIRHKDWEAGILFCGRYLEIYGENEYAEELKEVKDILSVQWELKKTLSQLISEAASKGDNYMAARRVFTRYLGRNPESEIRGRVESEILKVDQARERYRLEKETIRALDRISDLPERFTVSKNGTFTDKRSGLMWALLDSEIITGSCMDYEEARAYVSNLRTGGFTDWRLPETRELVQLHKEKPYFPAKKTNWYWSASVYKKFQDGWRHVVYVIDSEPSDVWAERQMEAFECGRVRAVRKAR